MSRPSVADLVERLQDSGLIEVVGESGGDRRGPNARVYGIVADRAYVAGLDVRIESIGVEIADLLGRTVARAERPVPPGADPAAIIEDGIALLLGAARRGRRRRPAHRRLRRPRPRSTPAPGGSARRARCPPGTPTSSTRCASGSACPSCWRTRPTSPPSPSSAPAAADGDDTFVLLWIGGGVGAGVVLDGRLRRGVSGGAGEVGFLPVSPGGDMPTRRRLRQRATTGSSAAGRSARSPARTGWPPGAAQDAAAAAGAVRRGARRGAGRERVPRRTRHPDRARGRVHLRGARPRAGRARRRGGRGRRRRSSPAASATALARLSPLRTGCEVSAVRAAPILRGAVITAMDAAQGELFAPSE